MAFDNIQGITEIKYASRVRCFCPLGDDWYSADVGIEVQLPDRIPDYCELDAFVRSMDSQKLILEDVCSNVWERVKQETRGVVRVSVSSSDAVHSPVTVVKAG